MDIKRLVASGAVGVAALTGAGAAFGTGMVLAQEDGAEEEQGEDQRPRGEGPGGCLGRGPRPGLDAAAQAIGIEEEALRDALRDGQTIAQVAEANGVAVQTVIDAMVADAEAHLDQAVADGRLTQEQADEKKANLPERITAIVNGERPEGAPPGPGGDRADDDEDEAPADEDEGGEGESGGGEDTSA